MHKNDPYSHWLTRIDTGMNFGFVQAGTAYTSIILRRRQRLWRNDSGEEERETVGGGGQQITGTSTVKCFLVASNGQAVCTWATIHATVHHMRVLYSFV